MCADDFSSPPPPLWPAELVLRCLNCDYDLTGLPENRCPECGEPFDPWELRALHYNIPQRLPGTNGMLLPDALTIWALAFFAPRELARRLPACVETEQRRWHSVASYATALLILVLGMLTIAGKPTLQIAPAAVCGTLCGFWLCETLVAALLTAVLKPRGIHKPYLFWRGLTHLTSGFSLLTGLWGVFGTLAACFIPFSGPAVCVVLGLGTPGLIWWALTLGNMVALRAPAGPRLGLCRIMIPIIGMVCAALGILVARVVSRFC